MSSCTILVIEDDASWRYLLSHFIAELGYECLEAGSIDDVKRIPEHSTIALSIVDIRLEDDDSSDYSGLESVDWLATRFPNMKTVVLSAYGTLSFVCRALHEQGVVDFIDKSYFSYEVLSTAIQGALGLKR